MVVQAKQQARAGVTRALVLDAAAVEFAARGYAAASLTTILEASGRTKGALYFHFASKDALVDAVLDAAHARYTVIAEPWKGTVEDPMSALAGLIGDVVGAVAAEPVLQAEIRLGTESGRGPGRTHRASLAWETVALELACAAEDMGCFTSPFTPSQFVRSLVTMIAGQHVLSRLVAEPLTLHARYIESCDTVVAAMTTDTAFAAYRRRA